MKFSFLFLLVCYTYCLGQNPPYYRISYLYENSGYANEQILYGNSSSSVYVTTPMVKKGSPEPYTVDGTEYTLNPGTIRLNQSLYFQTVNDNNIYGVLSLNENDRFVVIDSTVVMNWKLIDDVKIISGVKCKGATLSFRGRKYTAYYNENIPVNVGPYKFRGLPGMIFLLETSLGDKYHRWLVRSYETNLPTVPFGYSLLKDLNFEKITLSEYVRLRDEQVATLFKTLTARNDSDSVLESSVIVRSGIERIYEWESPENGKKE